ncbi:hypothetical protein K469DRAFT_732013 [Zopfia rhizophila CBS 207.26]|uniref:MFS general substrate transporter n=1 Tax=Zopfia rhizophila CBS 207.26 TaxID=1314779 RepID=A0A6A6EL56_9PEZI|nr:hypothetical protein K469DRAFT_732013 [Zopfia rhizophila CBS 207.26]
MLLYLVAFRDVPIAQIQDPAQGLQELEKANSIINDHDSHSSNLESTLSKNCEKLPGYQGVQIRAVKSFGEPPPDGGLKAWTQAFMGHFVVFNTLGIIGSFGVFQPYYTSKLGFAPSPDSWIGSLQMLGHFCIGMFSGRALDAGYVQWIIVPGVFLSSLGMSMTSLCSQCGLQLCPAMSIAVAIVRSGSTIGGLVYPTIVRQPLSKLGFSWAVRVIAFIMLAPRPSPRKSSPTLTLTTFREAPCTLYCAGVILVTLGLFFTFYYIGSFGLRIIGISYSTLVNRPMVMNGFGLGRLTLSYLAVLNSVRGLCAFAITYGLFTAGSQGPFPVVITSLTTDIKAGVRNGIGFSTIGFATLTGPPWLVR